MATYGSGAAMWGWWWTRDTLIHANAHHMAVAYEPLEHAVLRIRAQGNGEVVAKRRL